MKFLFALLALTPLVYCATLTHEEQLIIQSMTNEQKRALFSDYLPSLSTITHSLCVALGSDTSEAACELACPAVVSVIPFASALCPSACHALQSYATC